jgi:hypothetical protein
MAPEDKNMTALTPERPARYFSTIGGLTVGWDLCGECHRHVLICPCEDGPSEPAHLAADRTPSDPPFSALIDSSSAAA